MQHPPGEACAVDETWRYVEYPDSAALTAAETAARKARKGLWTGPRPVPTLALPRQTEG